MSVRKNGLFSFSKQRCTDKRTNIGTCHKPNCIVAAFIVACRNHILVDFVSNRGVIKGIPSGRCSAGYVLIVWQDRPQTVNPVSEVMHGRGAQSRVRLSSWIQNVLTDDMDLETRPTPKRGPE